MNRVQIAAELLAAEVDDVRSQCDAAAGDIRLASRLVRIQIISALCNSYGVAADQSGGFVSERDLAAAYLDGRSVPSNVVDRLCGCFTPINACAPERGRASVDEVSSRHKQLSLELGIDQ